MKLMMKVHSSLKDVLPVLVPFHFYRLWYYNFLLILLIRSAGLKSIGTCSRLTVLKLGICLNITNEGLSHIGRSCSRLVELDLYRLVIKSKSNSEQKIPSLGVL